MAVSTQIKKGDELMLFIRMKNADGEYTGDIKSIAQATSHTLSLTTETTSVSSKDYGVYGKVLPNRITWEITSENLFTDDEPNKQGFQTLFNAMQAMDEIEVVFGYSGNWNNGAGLDDSNLNYTPASNGKVRLTGKAIITSLSVNAAAGDNATFSVTLQGSGEIKHMA